MTDILKIAKSILGISQSNKRTKPNYIELNRTMPIIHEVNGKVMVRCDVCTIPIFEKHINKCPFCRNIKKEENKNE